MKRYAAFLRGISPVNAKMPDLVRAFEAAGFQDVNTILSSGNVNFSARASTAAKLQERAEKAMQAQLGRTFLTIVRELDAVAALLSSEPYARFKPPSDGKRVVTILREPISGKLKLPISERGVHIYSVEDGAVLSAYVPSADGPIFMKLLEKTFGKDQTTRTWDTLTKVVKAG